MAFSLIPLNRGVLAPLNLPIPFFATVMTIIAVWPTAGRSLMVCARYLEGAVVGAIFGVPTCYALMHVPPSWWPAAVIGSSFVCPLLLSASPWIRSKPITLVCWYISMSASASGQWDLGFRLIGTVAFGLIAGIIATLLPLPRPASAVMESKGHLRKALSVTRRLLLSLQVP
jgi:uncharacterized membrane protein YgaE (UPF0421/DUF939 family)